MLSHQREFLLLVASAGYLIKPMEFNNQIFFVIILGNSKKFKCGKCEKSYKHRPNLYRHSKYECDGVPKFICELCGKAYTQKVTLKQHRDSFHLHAVFNINDINYMKEEAYL